MPEQLTRDQLAELTPAEVSAAYRAGQLQAVTGFAGTPEHREGQLELDDARRMTRQQIHAALRAGQFAHLLAGKNS